LFPTAGGESARGGNPPVGPRRRVLPDLLKGKIELSADGTGVTNWEEGAQEAERNPEEDENRPGKKEDKPDRKEPARNP
jgi:hypothetical protein